MKVTICSALVVVSVSLNGFREAKDSSRSILESDLVAKTTVKMSEKASGTESSKDVSGGLSAAKKSMATALPAINDFLQAHMFQEVVIFEVGACDGNFGDSNDPVQSIVSQRGIRTELVEPNPGVFPKLQENVEKYCASDHCNTHAHNYAISRTSGTLPFFVVSPRFAEDHESAPHWAKYQLSSFSRDQILKHAPKLELTNEAFSKYIDQIDVPALTAADFFEDVHVSPGDLDILIIDAEGFDDEVLNSFLDVEKCEPSVLVFEAKHLSETKLNTVLARLTQMGYTTSDSDGNVLAVRSWTKGLRETKRRSFGSLVEDRRSASRPLSSVTSASRSAVERGGSARLSSPSSEMSG